MKRDWIYWVVMGLVFAFVYAYTFDKKLDLNGDNAQYLILADNLADGLGYNTQTPDGPQPHTHFPPGYPVFLSLFMRIGATNLVFLKLLNGLLFAGSLLLLFCMTARLTGNRALALAGCLLPVFSPQVLHFSHMVMSEMLFMFLSVLSLFSLYRYARQEGGVRFFRSPWFYAAIVSAAASYYVRAVGLATLFAVLVFFLFRKEWWQAGCSAAGGVLLLLPWFIRGKLVGGGGRYLDAILAVNHWRPEEGHISSLGGLLGKMLDNFDEAVIKGFKEILFPFAQVDYSAASGIGGVLGGVLVLALIGYGAWRLGSMRWAVIAFIVGNIGMVVLGTGGNGSRYIVPIAPVLYLCFYGGIYHLLADWIMPKATKALAYLPYAFLLTVLAAWPPVEALAKQSKMPTPPAYRNYYAIAQAMQKQLPAGTVCACRKPELFRYYAPDIYPVRYLYSNQPAEVVANLVAQQVDFVVLEQLGYSSTYLYLYPAIQAYPKLFPVVMHLPAPDTYLLKFEREQAEAALGGTTGSK